MPRSARVVVPGLPHNLCLRGNNRRRLFSSVGDRQRFLHFLSLGVRASGCALHQLTLMANHVHLVATPPSETALATLVARTCQRYAQRRNEAREASGKLFEERYYSRVIEAPEALLMIMLYNDANGYRAGVADSPWGHVWSTGPLHAAADGGRVPATLWTPGPWYLSLGADACARARVYRELMADYARRPATPDGVVEPEARPYSMRLERPDRSFAREDFRGTRQKLM